jgi:hypothetical protein
MRYNHRGCIAEGCVQGFDQFRFFGSVHRSSPLVMGLAFQPRLHEGCRIMRPSHGLPIVQAKFSLSPSE